MTNFSNTGSIPAHFYYTAGTIQARELLLAYQEYDKVRDLHALLWPFQWAIKRQWRQLCLRLCEARSNVVHWGGRL